MNNYGVLIGWLIVAGLVLALFNYAVKVVNRKWVSGLDTNSAFRRFYSRLQRLIVQNHRFFAIFAASMMALHIYIQLTYRWLSWTGLIAAALLGFNLMLGTYGHYIKKKKRSAWFYTHRTVAVLVVISIAAHIIFSAR